MILHSSGVDIFVREQGLAGPPVLLLHGWGCDSTMWKIIAERLSREARVFLLDFPGHGESSALVTPWDTKDYAAMVADIIERLDIAGCVVVGHSHGGRVALRLALDSPKLVGKLVITGGAGLRAKPAGKRKLKSEAYRLMKNCLLAIDNTKAFGSLPKRGLDKLRKVFSSPDFAALKDDVSRATFIKLVSTDMTDELALIRKPTLLIWGENDAETPLWMGEKMKQLIPDSGLVVLSGGDHFAHIRQPDRFATIVAAFL